jgi:3-oxoacyl-[acyl-carrier-protein] synthase II
MAAAAAAEAVRQAGLVPGALPDPARAGVCAGTTMGEVRILEEWVERGGAPEDGGTLADYPCHVIAEGVAGFLGAEGPVLMVPNACAAGNFALAIARDLLLDGRADRILVVGVDPYSRVAHTGFNRLLAASPDVCRPFDARRRGIVPGEGAGALLLEREGAAAARGAEILAFLAGCGLGNDAVHMTNPDPEGHGLARAMREALREGGLSPGDVDWVSAHGTGTPANDAAEARAIRLVFGEGAARVPVSSVKSMIGHTMGAASALEAVASVLAIREGFIPPTANFGQPDPECALDVVPNACRRAKVRAVLSNSMAFGGNNSCVLFRSAGE